MKKQKQGPCSTCGGAHPPDGAHRTHAGAHAEHVGLTFSGKRGTRAGPVVMAKIRERQISADVLSMPLVAMTDFPDEAFEGFSKRPEPECAVCEGSLRAGQILVVLDKGRISHLSCFEGTKVHAAKGDGEQTEAEAVLMEGAVVMFAGDTAQDCRHVRWSNTDGEPRSAIPVGRYLVSGVVGDDVKLTVMLDGNPSAKHHYLVPKDAPWGQWMSDGVVALSAARETPECNGDHESCDGQIVEEYDLKIGKKKTIRVAITGYHHGSNGHDIPWEYFHVGEVVKRPDGGTEIEELLPDPFPEKPTADDIRKALA